jgi:hypothetical protein
LKKLCASKGDLRECDAVLEAGSAQLGEIMEGSWRISRKIHDINTMNSAMAVRLIAAMPFEIVAARASAMSYSQEAR